MFNQILKKIQPYIYPTNLLDNRLIARFSLGLINYAQVKSWWAISVIQKNIENSVFQFSWNEKGERLDFFCSGADPTHLWVANEILLDRVYNFSVIPFVPEVIIDFGANTGIFTLLAHKYWKNSVFVCVEPDPKTFTFLCMNLEKNNINATKLQCAVSSNSSIKYLGEQNAVFQTVTDAGNVEHSVLAIPMETITNCVSAHKILIKIDIEGSEYEIFESLNFELPKECFVFVELHHGDDSLTMIEKWAEKFNFNFIETRRRDNAIDGYLIKN